MFFSKHDKSEKLKSSFFNNPLVRGLSTVLFFMVLFYYFERYNIFPMNFLRSIQYHRIIPEFIITAAALIAALSTLATSRLHKIVYYSLLGVFLIVSFIGIYNIQTQWQTTPQISNSQEFIDNNFTGRISFPYTDQSLSVRSSFNNISEVYGYYEQGITNSYADELFSVSSGYQNYENTLLYLKVANVERLYINMEEGERDVIMKNLLSSLKLVHENNSRYGYFEIPLANPSYAQAISSDQTNSIKILEPGCRIMFKQEYCGSVKEEFVASDSEEIRYLQEYVSALESKANTNISFYMVNPEKYKITLTNASDDTKVVIKMTYDSDFKAYVGNKRIKIEKIGPDFMLLSPTQSGNYEISLSYSPSYSIVYIGGIISIISFISLVIFFSIRHKLNKKSNNFKVGDL